MDAPRAVGPFTVLRLLGEGGMGQVHLGRSPDGALAAVKVIRADLAADREFRARFRQEVELASRVRSPRTVAVLAADPHAAAPWLATEYVPAPSLREVVGAHGPLPADALRRLGAGLAEGLTAIHAAGVVHRDLKPGNVLLAEDGPRIIDFGIARAADGTMLTRTGAVIGTPGFIAPEQVLHHATGPEADVFALGGLLLYAATGRSPFGEGEPAVVLYRALHLEADGRRAAPWPSATHSRYRAPSAVTSSATATRCSAARPCPTARRSAWATPCARAGRTASSAR